MSRKSPAQAGLFLSRPSAIGRACSACVVCFWRRSGRTQACCSPPTWSFREAADSAPWIVANRVAKTGSHPCVFSSALRGRRVTSLCLPKEKSPREMAPSRPRFAGLPRPANYASGLRGSLTVRPCTDSERTRLLRVPLRADPPPARRGRVGTGEAKAFCFGTLCDAAEADGRGRVRCTRAARGIVPLLPQARRACRQNPGRP